MQAGEEERTATLSLQQAGGAALHTLCPLFLSRTHATSLEGNRGQRVSKRTLHLHTPRLES